MSSACGNIASPRRAIALLLLFSALALLQPAMAPAAKFGQRMLGPGMRGKDVRVLQRSLTRLKLPTKTTGRYRGQTRKNVRRLERRQGWPVDGRVQRRQAKKIRRIISKRRQRKRARRVAGGAQVFPIPGPHNYGGSEARFGASRSGHSHQGQDVFAACGERLVSAQAGNVKARGYQGGGAGHYLVVVGVDGIDYVYMHLAKASWAAQGAWVYAGTQIGKVGQSGNASGCHLHFELWTAPGWYTGGAPNDPLPSLLYWDAYS
jgi:murein DD-endopeptidase MepM/ murein hydrolase activator NlpD